MRNPRTTPVNERVAAAHLKDVPEGLERVTGQPRRITVSVVDLLRRPDGKRDRQLLLGEPVMLFEDRFGTSFVQAEKDGYVGYVETDALGPPAETTHRVQTPSTHAYTDADIRSPDLMPLSFGSQVTALSEGERFIETTAGFIPKSHLCPADHLFDDPVEVAALFLGSPYLWGGNSRWGIDCSGLVQAALITCGINCPGDSNQQERVLGTPLPQGTTPGRGDLLFWKGHVGLVADPDTLLHANAHHMAVRYEPLPEAIRRIEAQGDGPVTAHRRLSR